MNEIKAIPTRYKGYKMRSRTEARWGVYFDAVGIEWEYEKEGFQLPSGPYLPDFWLPQVKMWAEVKPFKFTDRERNLAKELAEGTGYPVLMLVGPPEEKSYYAIPTGIDHDNFLDDYVLGNEYLLSEHRFFSSHGDSPTNDKAVELGVRAARSARFEFGESGAT